MMKLGKTDFYVLAEDGKTPVPVDDVQEWARQREKREDRVVQQDDIEGFLVSTVFLGLDHSFGDGPPVLWETMVFDHRGGPSYADEYQDRYSSYEAAVEGHQKAIEWTKAKLEAGDADGISGGMDRDGS